MVRPKCLFLESCLLCVFEDTQCYLCIESLFLPSVTALELCQLFPKGNLDGRARQVKQLTQGSRVGEDGPAALLRVYL